jgi:L-iditol 2-dehydrogenase
MFAHCQQQSTFGFMTGCDGAAAEYVALPPNARLHRVPEGMDAKTALLAYDEAQAGRCADLARLTEDDLVVLACDGALGLAVARRIAKGPHKGLIVLSEDEGCLRAALELGADVAVNPARAAILRDKRMMLLPGEFDILKYTGGYGCDVFINTSESEKNVALGLELLSKAGRYVECAVFGGWTYADWSLVCAQKELTVMGVKRGAGDFEEAIASLMEDRALGNALRFTEYGRENWREAFEKQLGATEKRLIGIG